MRKKSSVMAIFAEFLISYPKHFLLLFLLLIFEGVVAAISVMSIVPMADWTSYSLHDTSVGGGNGKLMYIYEVILYNSALSDIDREKIEDYLGTKYSISIV